MTTDHSILGMFVVLSPHRSAHSVMFYRETVNDTTWQSSNRDAKPFFLPAGTM